MKEKESLKERAYTSFGKLVLAPEKTAPVYSNHYPNIKAFPAVIDSASTVK
jgi:hypothetical protein